MSESAGGNNRLLAMIRSLLIFVLLVGVIVGSFWISFELGKRVLGSVSNPPVKSIPVKIPAVPPEIAGLQEKPVKQPKEPAIDAPIEEKDIAKNYPVAVTTTIKKLTRVVAKKSVIPVRLRYYKVQAGVFEDRESAHDLARELKENGIDNFIKKTVAGWRVQVGAYKTRGQAEGQQIVLRNKGYNTSIIIE